MPEYIEHHLLALFSCNTAALELLSTQPKTDAVCELIQLMEDQFDIIDCVIHNRHFGSDGLDSVIEECNNVVNQVREFEQK